MQNIIDALNWRYAVKTFDPAKSVSDESFRMILEAGRLAPSSFGIESWKFIVVENPELRAKLRAVSYGQTKVTDATHIVVMAARTDVSALAGELVERTARIQGVDAASLDGLKNMVDGYVAGMSAEKALAYAREQTFIALGMMVETAALLGVDSCPMGGFDQAGVDALLGLSAQNLTACSMLAVGYRGDDETASRPKVRRAFDEVVEFVR
ncbi:MAG: NAD(P)H-dependent oxidoreductase [Candidatus Uhrbacteria bacterium]